MMRLRLKRLAAETGDPWVVRRVANFFWHFLESFFLSVELMLRALSYPMRVYLLEGVRPISQQTEVTEEKRITARCSW